MAATLNAKPWRILKSRASLTKPGVSWFNAVTQVLMTMGIRVGRPGEELGIERPNSNGKFWNIILPVDVVGGGGGRWTGAVWFANTLMHDYSEDAGWPADILTGRYLACHLITGASRFIDDLGDVDDDNEQVHQVATRTLVSEDPDVYSYALSNNTQGDIIIRVT